MFDHSRYITFLVLIALSFFCGCRSSEPENVTVAESSTAELSVGPEPTISPTPTVPNLQTELSDGRFNTTSSEIGNFDFRNFTYPLPRGWQHPESKEITLENGKVKPVAVDIDEEMSDEERAKRRASRRIGMSYVTTRFLDITSDGSDEAAVILKVETGGASIPQIVYIFEWKSGAPELIWYFRTGDRADGGLKDIRVDNSLFTVELYGQDRFLLGETETGKITGDEEQICCPTFFTRTQYKWNGKSFIMQGKRLTYEIADPSKTPLENFGDIMNDPIKSKKYLDGQKRDR